MKRLTALLLILAALLGMCSAVSAEAPFRYELREDGVWITGANAGGDLTVPAEIDGVPVVGLADGAFFNNETVTSVTLPEGLREIGSSVFTGCTGIRQTLQIPDSVESIAPWSLGTLEYEGKSFSAADRYRLTSYTEGYHSAGTLPGYRCVQDGGMVYWLHGGEAELVSVQYFTDPVIVLPASVLGCPVTSVGPWCCGRMESMCGEGRPHITVPGSVKRLRAHAFQGAWVTSLYLEEGVRTLEPCSLAANQQAVVTVPASAADVTGPLFRHHAFITPPKVYAYSGSEAARLAMSEGCELVHRDAADGRCYGVREGMEFYIEDGQVTVYGGKTFPHFYEEEIKEIPATIDGCPVTSVAIGVFSGSRNILIPPGVTSLTFEAGGLGYSDRLLYYPGSYAEAFCRQNRLNAQSIYTFRGVPFADVPDSAWYCESVCYVYQTGLMNGVGAQAFSPNGDTSRAMLVTVLWRMAGQPQTEESCPFTDVEAGSWYAPAVRWAYAAGVTRGVSETAFAPDAPVTREQIAALLLRYAQIQGLEAEARAEIVNYPDAKAVSDWAVEAMQWARAAGIVKGRLRGGDVFLDPRTTARRCEIAEMLMRFCLRSH